jgi:hypothetical protein
MPMVVFCLDLVSYVVILTDFSGNFESCDKLKFSDGYVPYKYKATFCNSRFVVALT